MKRPHRTLAQVLDMYAVHDASRRATEDRKRKILSEPGAHSAVAEKFGVSPAYVCMVKNGSRPIKFTPVEVMSATLVSLAFTGEA